MKLNGLSAPESAGHRRRRAALATAALMAGFTMASSEAAFAHHYSNGTTCDRGYAAYQAAGAPLPAPEAAIRLVFNDRFDAFRGTEEAPLTDTGTAVNVYARGKPAPGQQISDFCRWFDDQAKPSTQHYDGDGPFVPGMDGWAENGIGHTYTQPGKYELFVHAIDEQVPQKAWSTRVKRMIEVNGRPTASFTYGPTKPKPGQEITFTSTSADHPAEVGGPRPLKSYAWDLDGDGKYNQPSDRKFGSADEATAKYTYASDAPVTVRLQVRDDKDARPLVPAERVVSLKDTAPVTSFSYSPTSPQPEQAVTFTSSSTDADGDRIVKWEWDLNGDGVYNEGSTASVSYAFPRSGLFPVSLKVTDDRGTSSNVAQQTVSVVDPPALAATNPVAPTGAVVPTRSVGTRQTATTARLRARVSLRSRLTRAGARFSTLTVSTARGATIKVRCKGGGCKTRAQTLRSKGKALRLTRFQRSYRAGAVIQVYVAKPGSVGRYVRIKVRKGMAPLRTDLCLKSGRASRC